MVWINHQKYMDSKQLAADLDMREQLVRSWRSQGEGPPYVRVKGRIYYERAAVEKWKAEQLKPIIPKKKRA